MSDAIIKRLRVAIAEHPLSPIHGYAADIAALLDRLDKAERENKRMREDAERYRWLRGRAEGHYMTVCASRTDIDEVCLGDALDAAIDAARAAEKGKE